MKKKPESITCGIFYCRDSAKMKGCSSLQTSSWFDSDVLRSRQQKHTAVRYTACKKIQEKNCICNGAFYNGEIKCTKDLRT